jgi:protocatechuate 3,4-dioxygenase beta subunit
MGARWRVAGGLVAVLLGAAAAPASAKVYVPDCNYEPVFKPDKIQFCDVGVLRQVYHLEWSKWGGKKAEADGKYRYQTCDPSCVNGKVRHRKAHVELFRRRHCSYSGERVYTRMRIITKNEPRSAHTIKCHPSG